MPKRCTTISAAAILATAGAAHAQPLTLTSETVNREFAAVLLDTGSSAFRDQTVVFDYDVLTAGEYPISSASLSEGSWGQISCDAFARHRLRSSENDPTIQINGGIGMFATTGAATGFGSGLTDYSIEFDLHEPTLATLFVSTGLSQDQGLGGQFAQRDLRFEAIITGPGGEVFLDHTYQLSAGRNDPVFPTNEHIPGVFLPAGAYRVDFTQSYDAYASGTNKSTGFSTRVSIYTEASATGCLGGVGESYRACENTTTQDCFATGGVPYAGGCAVSFCRADNTFTNANPGDTGYGYGDGVVDGADLTYQIQAFLSGDPRADITTTNTTPDDAQNYGRADGVIDGADLSFYIELWLSSLNGGPCFLD